MSTKNRAIVLASRPRGAVTPQNFRIVDTELSEIGPGELLVRNHYLSLDPYMRCLLYTSPSPRD